MTFIIIIFIDLYACKLGAGFNNNALALEYFFKVPPYNTIIGFNLVIHNGGEDMSQSAQDCSMSTEEQEDEQSGQKYEKLEEVTEQPWLQS